MSRFEEITGVVKNIHAKGYAFVKWRKSKTETIDIFVNPKLVQEAGDGFQEGSMATVSGESYWSEGAPKYNATSIDSFTPVQTFQGRGVVKSYDRKRGFGYVEVLAHNIADNPDAVDVRFGREVATTLPHLPGKGMPIAVEFQTYANGFSATAATHNQEIADLVIEDMGLAEGEEVDETTDSSDDAEVEAASPAAEAVIDPIGPMTEDASEDGATETGS